MALGFFLHEKYNYLTPFVSRVTERELNFFAKNQNAVMRRQFENKIVFLLWLCQHHGKYFENCLRREDLFMMIIY